MHFCVNILLPPNVCEHIHLEHESHQIRLLMTSQLAQLILSTCHTFLQRQSICPWKPSVHSMGLHGTIHRLQTWWSLDKYHDCATLDAQHLWGRVDCRWLAWMLAFRIFRGSFKRLNPFLKLLWDIQPSTLNIFMLKFNIVSSVNTNWWKGSQSPQLERLPVTTGWFPLYIISLPFCTDVLLHTWSKDLAIAYFMQQE